MKLRLALFLLGPLIAYLVVGQISPRSELDIGSFIDSPFVSGFHDREATAEYTYRWTQQTAKVVLWGLPPLTNVTVYARLSGFRPSGEPTSFTAYVGDTVSVYPAPRELTTLPLGSSRTDAIGRLEVRLESSTFSTPTDPRKMGLKIDLIEGRAQGPAPYLPSPVVAGALMLVALSWLPLRGRISGLISMVFAGMVIGTTALGWAATGLFVAVAGIVAGAATSVAFYRRATLAWISSLDTPRKATRLLGLAILVWTAFALWTIVNTDFIGHADYADNAVVARNLIAGKGMVTDYIAQFYTKYESVTHSSDTWPPLQPLLIALSFAILGISTWTAKIPNLLIMVALATATYRIAAAVSSPLGGLLAATAVLTHDYLFSGVVYPLNDVGFTFLATLLFSEAARIAINTGHLTPLRGVYIGILLGLIALAKPSGLLLASSLVVPLSLLWRHRHFTWQPWAIAFLVASLVYFPWALRNLELFGYPFYGTEVHDAYVLRYMPPWENIYRLYWGDAPGFKQFLQAGWDPWMQSTWTEAKNLWTTLATGRAVPLGILVLSLGGILTARRPTASLIWCVAVGTAGYAGLIISYWHVETRYFVYLVPVSATVAAAFLQRLRELVPPRVAPLLLPSAILLAAYLQGSEIVTDSLKYYTAPTSIVQAAHWARSNLPPDAVVLTRNPWEFAFHSERKAVMIPMGPAPHIVLVARLYGARYIQLDHLNNPVRPALAPLYRGAIPSGFHLLYRNGDVVIYSVDDAGLESLRLGNLE